jgi:hypothetical protein
MAKFKDNATGNVFEFTLEHDIQTMRKHPEYTEIVEEVKQEIKTSKKTKQTEEV